MLLSFTNHAAFFWSQERLEDICILSWKESLPSFSQHRRPTGAGNIVERKDTAQTSWIKIGLGPSSLQPGLLHCAVINPWNASIPSLALLQDGRNGCLIDLDQQQGSAHDCGSYTFLDQVQSTWSRLATTANGHAIWSDWVDFLLVFVRRPFKKDVPVIRQKIECSQGFVTGGVPFLCTLSGTVGWVRYDGSVHIWTMDN